MEFHIMAIKKSSGSGIPFGNNAGRPANPGVGQLYSNGQAARLELYTQAGAWENIVQEVPGVSGISGTYSESANSGTIIVTGTNFVSGAIASATGTNSVEIQAQSTTYNSLVQLTAVFTGLSNANEPYDIKVTNPSNLFGILPDALYVNASPVWVTSAGSLGSFNEQVSITLSALSATDSDSNTITYALANGSTLPSGVTLNSSTGVISGTLPDISADTTYTFTINASDGTNIIPRTFSITSSYLINSEVLVVAGGGAGGVNAGAGGGAGGLYYNGSLSLNRSIVYTLSVGNGGSGASGANSTVSGSGFTTITALGGGKGTDSGGNGVSGGSGGGGAAAGTGGSATQPSSASGGFGFAGGNGNGQDGYDRAGAGGGGAGGVGQNAVSSSQGGAGGAGLSYSITGTSIGYAGGGGGSPHLGSPGAGTQGGGTGGIGSVTAGGVVGNGSTVGNPGTPNTGGGGGAGGGGGLAGGAGGSGVIVIAYPDTFPAITTISGGLTYDQPSRSGYRVYRFTAGSGTITF
jgi:hypothetical protein